MRISDWSSDVCSSDLAVTTLITDLGAAATAASEGVVDTAFGAVLFAAYIFLGTIFFFQAPAIATGIAGGAAAGVGAFAGTAWGTMASPFRQRRIARNSRNLERAARRGGRSEEHTSELQSLMRISYAVFCLKKK